MHKYMHLISFTRMAEVLSPTAPVFTEPLSSLIADKHASMFGDNRLLGTGNCSIQGIAAFFPTPLPEPLLWGPADQRREGSQKSNPFTNDKKEHMKSVYVAKKVKMRTPDKLAQERELTEESLPLRAL